MTIRYSPRPLDAYGGEVTQRTLGSPDKVIKYGPAASALLGGDPEAWNLAYLSHDFETELNHPDPQFTTNVRRTVQFVIATGETDMTGRRADEECVRHFLRTPPARAVKLLTRMARLKETPMYKAYGDGWVTTMGQRAKALSFSAPDQVDSVSEAAHYLQKFTGDAA